MSEATTSALTARHERDGVALTIWAGVHVPEAYTDPAAEFAHVAGGAAGVVDQTCLGVISLSGADRAGFLHRLTTADIRSFPPGSVHDAVFVSGKGRMLHHVRVWVRDEEIVLVHRAPGTRAILELLERYHFSEDVVFRDAGDRWACLHVIGTGAATVVAGVPGGADATAESVMEPRPGTAVFAGPWDGGYEILVAPGEAEELWDGLIAAGAAPIGRRAYDALRIEAGLPEPGSEISDDYNPLEAGMRQAISFRKGCYVGQEVIARLDTYDKVSRHLAVLRLKDESTAVAVGDRLVDDGREVGLLTSVSALPSAVGERAALGYIKKRDLAEGAEFEVRGADGQPSCRAIHVRIVST